MHSARWRLHYVFEELILKENWREIPASESNTSVTVTGLKIDVTLLRELNKTEKLKAIRLKRFAELILLVSEEMEEQKTTTPQKMFPIQKLYNS